ncbi:MAG: helix-turn-helix domain-containing protein [Bacteroides sp.]|nr:helix-turn-helix domain-containing protein [Ruminococcus sp.]MBD5272836.1 helix-turn-helix domain-containing protein [Bacteroides sp.]
MSIEQHLERIEALLAIRTKEVLTVKEVAALLDRSEVRIRALCSQREIPHYKNDRGQVSFLKSEIEEWRLGKKVLTNSEIETQAATYIATKRIS